MTTLQRIICTYSNALYLLFFFPLSLPSTSNLPDIHARPIRLPILMHTPLHTINQAFTPRLHTHMARPLVLLPCLLRHVFPAPLLRRIRRILLAVCRLQTGIDI